MERAHPWQKSRHEHRAKGGDFQHKGFSLLSKSLQTRGGATLVLLLLYIIQPVTGLESCGCSGWQFPDAAFIDGNKIYNTYDVESYITSVVDCEGCQSTEGISLSSGAHLNLGALTYGGDLTFTVWIYATNPTPWQRIFDFGSGAGTDNHLLQFDDTATKLMFTTYFGGSTMYIKETKGVAVNSWVHIAVTCSSSNATMYIDGEVAASGAVFNTGVVTRTNCLIGDDNWGDEQKHWVGRMADFRMYERALSALEVVNLRFGLFADDSSLFSFFNCYTYQYSCPQEDRCGCAGWEIPASSLLGRAYSASVAECSGCQSEDGIFFENVGDYVDLGTLTFDDSAVTYAAWIYAQSAENSSAVFDFGSGRRSNNQMLRVSNGTGLLQLQFQAWDGDTDPESGKHKALIAPEVLALNTWVHVSVAVAGSTATLRLNGLAVASGIVGNAANQTRDMSYLGRDNQGGAGSYWHGRIADFRMYSRALSPSETWQLAQGTLADGSSLFGFFRCAKPRASSGCASCGCPAYDLSALVSAGDTQSPSLQTFNRTCESVQTAEQCSVGYAGYEYAFSVSGYKLDSPAGRFNGDYYKTDVLWIAYPLWQVSPSGHPVYANIAANTHIIQNNGRDGWDFVTRTDVNSGSLNGYAQTSGRSGYRNLPVVGSIFTWGAHPSATMWLRTSWTKACVAVEAACVTVPDCPLCQSREALTFDGVDDQLDVGPMAYGSDVTFVAWVRAEKQGMTLFDFGDGEVRNSQTLKTLASTGELVFESHSRPDCSVRAPQGLGAGNDACCQGLCDVGEGNCAADTDCAGGLVCGSNNCAWGNGDNCCMQPPVGYTATPSVDSCGCPGYAFPASSFKNGAVYAPLTDCDGCQSHSGVELDGVDDHLDLGPLTYDCSDVTYSAWVRLRSYTRNARVFEFGDRSGNRHLLRTLGTRQLSFNTYNTDAPNTTLADQRRMITDPSQMPLNAWIHVVVTVARQSPSVSAWAWASLYVNGVLVAGGDVHDLGILTHPTSLLGQSLFADYGDEWWHGTIADLKMFGRALSTAETRMLAVGAAAYDASLLPLFSCAAHTSQCPRPAKWACASGHRVLGGRAPSLANAAFDSDVVTGWSERTPSGWRGMRTFVVANGDSSWGGLSSGDGANYLALHKTLINNITSSSSYAEQTMDGLVPGQQYTLRFLAANRPANGDGELLTVSIDGQPVLGPMHPANTFTAYEGEFTATAAVSVLRFENDSPDGNTSVLVDAVQICVASRIASAAPLALNEWVHVAVSVAGQSTLLFETKTGQANSARCDGEYAITPYVFQNKSTYWNTAQDRVLHAGLDGGSWVLVSSADFFQAYLGGGVGTYLHVLNGMDPTLGWDQYDVTERSTAMYVDGVEVARGAVEDLGAITRSTGYLGRSQAARGALWKGNMADFRMYGRVLTGAEVEGLRTGTAKYDADLLPLFGCGSYYDCCDCEAEATTTSTSTTSTTTTTPAPTTSSAPMTSTPPPVFNSSACLEQNVSVSAQCKGVASLRVTGCAPSRFGFENSVLQLEAGGALADAAATCAGFYAWMCASLGTVALGGGEDCAFPCQFWEGVRANVEGGCSVQQECLEETTTLNMGPAPGSLCYDEARYALYASCVANPGFAANVDALLATANHACANTSTETLFVSGFISAPPWVSPPSCSDGNDDFTVACFRSPFAVKRVGASVTLSSLYAGPFDCSVRGLFEGALEYQNGLELRASNAEGAQVTLKPLPTLNQIRVSFEFGAQETCVYLWELQQGSLLGLPVEEALAYTPESALAFVGFDAELAQGAVARRRRSAESMLHGREESMRRLAAAPELECPREASDCRYACMADGLAASAFGTQLALLPTYASDAACDCALVFPQDLGGAPGMVGSMAEANGEISFHFPAGIDVQGLGGAGRGGLVDVTLRPLAASSQLMRLDFSLPSSHCTYVFGVDSGLLLGVQGAAPEELAEEAALLLAASPPDAVDSSSSAEADAEAGPGSKAEPGLFEISVAEAEETAEFVGAAVGATAAAVVLSSVISTVVANVAAAVAGSVGGQRQGRPGGRGCCGGAAAGAAAGAGGNGNGGGRSAALMIGQCGHIALLSRIGDGGLPEAASATGSGLQWANGHPPVNVWKLFGEGDTGLAYLRRAGKGSRGAGAVGDSPSDIRGCEVARGSNRELFGTLLLVFVVLALSLLVRRSVNALIKRLRTRHGKDPGDDVLPFPLWEIQILLIFYMGLAESAGEAIATGCLYYEIAGAAVLLGLLVVTLLVLFIVVVVLRRTAMVYWDVPLKDSLRQAKEEVAGWRKMKAASKANHAFAAWLIFKQRGQWEGKPVPDPALSKMFGGRFADRLSCVFDSYKRGASFYGFWVLVKAMGSALVITNILAPAVNAAIILGFNSLDVAIILLFMPDIEWSLLVLNTWKACCNLASVAAALAFMADWLTAGFFTNAFFLVQLCSLIPLMIASTLGPVLHLLKGIQSLLDTCYYSVNSISLLVGGGAGGAIVAAKAVNLVAAHDDGMKQAVLQAVDDSDSDKGSDSDRNRGNKEEKRKSNAANSLQDIDLEHSGGSSPVSPCAGTSRGAAKTASSRPASPFSVREAWGASSEESFGGSSRALLGPDSSRLHDSPPNSPFVPGSRLHDSQAGGELGEGAAAAGSLFAASAAKSGQRLLHSDEPGPGPDSDLKKKKKKKKKKTAGGADGLRKRPSSSGASKPRTASASVSSRSISRKGFS